MTCHAEKGLQVNNTASLQPKLRCQLSHVAHDLMKNMLMVQVLLMGMLEALREAAQTLQRHLLGMEEMLHTPAQCLRTGDQPVHYKKLSRPSSLQP